MPRTIQWLNENSYRAYPFVEDSDMSAGAQTVPNDLLLDLQLLEFVAAEEPMTLTTITVTGITIDLALVYGEITRTLTVLATSATHTLINYGTGDPYRITAIYGPGIETVGEWADGTYTLSTPAPVEASLLNFENNHRVASVQGLYPLKQELLTGTVFVREGHNCRVTVDANRDLVIVYASRGSGAGISCDPIDPDILSCGEVLLRINSLRADSNGNFLFMEGPGVQIQSDPDNNRVIFKSNLGDEEVNCG